MRNPVPSSTLQISYGLPGGLRVPLAYWALIRGRIKAIIPFLSHDKEYKPQFLLGSSFWRALNHAETRIANLCVAEMVRKGELPLKVADNTSGVSAKYQLA